MLFKFAYLALLIGLQPEKQNQIFFCKPQTSDHGKGKGMEPA